MIGEIVLVSPANKRVSFGDNFFCVFLSLVEEAGLLLSRWRNFGHKRSINAFI
jgi:hypothetical protein